ncbi:hypothetical protein [Ruegeria arenilitoris]|uniref:hypothetical protein n=1 Tax=Ruegeria arenilitoris TaxID=1173585 RepID=UPI00147A8D47|nr:hypothetical protein [Ruegeria arenilitoris]
MTAFLSTSLKRGYGHIARKKPVWSKFLQPTHDPDGHHSEIGKVYKIPDCLDLVWPPLKSEENSLEREWKYGKQDNGTNNQVRILLMFADPKKFPPF